MCGHVGMAGAIDYKLESMFRDMLTMDTVRGPHSTGVAIVDKDGSVVVSKKVGPPANLFDSKSFTKDMSGVNNVLLGHNRYATNGKINEVNAHPFHIGDIVGGHNGTMKTWHNLKDHTHFDVDSECIVNSINEIGINKTVSLLNGSFALVWWDQNSNTINLVRNSERDMWVAHTDDEKTFIWASEDWMIEAAAERNTVDITGISKLTELMHFSLEIKLGVGANLSKLPMAKARKVEEYIGGVFNHHGARDNKKKSSPSLGAGNPTKTTKKVSSANQMIHSTHQRVGRMERMNMLALRMLT